ncbi:hypothetical protein B0H13DRAFT_1896021 [Mycena leptocephala]|nr:hypothetical protein B0H13DRAFT_1896021 [Mycena leptocephala]
MECGFALSDMANLLMQYNQQNDDELSLFMRTTSIASKKAWGYRILSTAEILPDSLRAPDYLERAFPVRSPEERPPSVYYSAEGIRREITISERSSWGAGPDFAPPPPLSKNEKGKGRVASVQERRVEDKKERDWVPLRTNNESRHCRPIGICRMSLKDYWDKKFRTRMRIRSLYQGPRVAPLRRLRFLDQISPILYTGWLCQLSIAELPRVAEVDEESFHTASRTTILLHTWNPCHERNRVKKGIPRCRTAKTLILNHRFHVVLEEAPRRSDDRGEDVEPDRERAAGNDGGPPDGSDDEGSDDEDHGRRQGDGPNRGFHQPRRAGRPRRSPRNSRFPPDGGDDGGGDDGGGSDGGGGNGSIDRRFPYIAPGAPYGLIVPTIEPKLKPESLPEWDGDHDTAIDYFWQVGEMASLMGWLPKALGFWLPSRLKKGSPIQTWFSTLSSTRQAAMREHYLTYLQVIKDRYLGRKWQLRENIKFEQQAFRQRGHEDETPQMFFGRRVRAVRMLANSDDGGPLEVFLVMRKAPIKWSTILVMENIQSTEELYDKINEHDESLVDAVRHHAPDALTVGNLASTLKRLGYGPTAPANPRSFRRVNVAETGEQGRLGNTHRTTKTSRRSESIAYTEREEIEDEYWEQLLECQKRNSVFWKRTAEMMSRKVRGSAATAKRS